MTIKELREAMAGVAENTNINMVVFSHTIPVYGVVKWANGVILYDKASFIQQWNKENFCGTIIVGSEAEK